ncbi:pyruvate kinase [uncultured Maribacter sp.]|uniref:pyruvate kinase n=1 Tax=uncultured Maribacter sp. TaxID=431308 RepID=UPI0026322A34|nr:pyruvate kinase [uncultured Maribacter sp.]
MVFSKDELEDILNALDLAIAKLIEYEEKYKKPLHKVHPKYKQSAKNLIHYLALRSFDESFLQEKLEKIDMPFSPRIGNSIFYNLFYFQVIIKSLLKKEYSTCPAGIITNKEAKKTLQTNSEALFGKLKNQRKTGIMVTQPTEAATNSHLISSLLNLGMDCARINCAHDDKKIWKNIISHIKSIDSSCRIMMDLGGPKLRTGKMKAGPKVIRIKPKKNNFGKVIEPSKIWLAPIGVLPPENKIADAIIPVNKKWLKKTKKGSFIIFNDSRDRKRTITIEEEAPNGRWGHCYTSAFITTGTVLNVHLQNTSVSEIHSVHETQPLEEVIVLKEGDMLRLDKKPILGQASHYDSENGTTKIAHISCTLPEIFSAVKVNEPIYFDDGKIEGVITEVHLNFLIIKITTTKKNGGKLKADKGINLPASHIKVGGLTKKDKLDLNFVAKNADVVNFSFVNNAHDVSDLLHELKKRNANIGVLLKIETQKAFENLPSILLKAMQNYPVGVMIARGDLAIETGWKNVAIIQEEIMQLCDATHIPHVLATQVLENLAKKGIPTRAEITDAAMAQRAECVMLNKGPYIEKAVKMLDKILSKMQRIQKKKGAVLPKLVFNEEVLINQ